MPYSSVRRAIRKRFSTAHQFYRGVRVDDRCNPEIAPTAAMIGTQTPDCPPLSLYLNFQSKLQHVRVFEEDAGGHDVDHWPTISFRHVRDRPREETYFNAIDEDCLGCSTAINSRGEVVTGPALIRQRQMAQPKDLVFEFWMESLDADLGFELLSLMTELFPNKGSLETTRRDGSIAVLDMYEDVQPFRSRGFDPTLSGGDPGLRFYRWTSIYKVEAYSDNTLQGEWKQTVTSHCEDVNPSVEPTLIS